MYRYRDFDREYVRERIRVFRDQVARRLSGELTEEEFRPFRLMSGVYLQLHAYMLRVAIPYGMLSAGQLRCLADVAERWDRGWGHFTTRQNIQFNLPRLVDIPDMLEALAEVGMHAVQTSGNTIRNVTADPFAGAAADEVADPRPWAELIRQWSTDHPEFQFLPRKFKIAVTGSAADRAVTGAHDIGLVLRRDAAGRLGFRILVGGGMGRSPMVGHELASFVPAGELLAWLEATVAAWNLIGRRDNKYRARIKFAVHELGLEAFRAEVEAELARRRAPAPGLPAFFDEIVADFAPPPFTAEPVAPFEAALVADAAFARWARRNLVDHRREDHAIVVIPLKDPDRAPGDASAAEMRLTADLADAHGYGEIRVTPAQNLVLPHVPRARLPELHARLAAAGLAEPLAGLVTDTVACPGLDWCSLATARSIPVARELAARLAPLAEEVGPLAVRISGCINACGHHHVGEIGILGLERAGVETYQLTLGGDPEAGTRIGQRTGPGFAIDEIGPAVERLVRAYLALRTGPDETFSAALTRLGHAPFHAALYGDDESTSVAGSRENAPAGAARSHAA